MKIHATLREILHNCNDWDAFCKDKGWSEYAVAEGGGDIEVELTFLEAAKYGIIPNEEK